MNKDFTKNDGLYLLIDKDVNNFFTFVANHRNIVRMQVLMRELWLQMWHDIHPNMQSSFVTKGYNFSS